MNTDSLRQLTLLQHLDPEALAGIAAALEPRVLGDGHLLFQEGDPGDAMYFLTAGAIRIEKQTGADPAARKTLAVLEPGDYFGEMALLDQQPRSAAAVAAGETRVLRLSAAAFNTLQAGSQRAALGMLFAMIRTAGERIRRLNAQVVVYDEIGKAIGESPGLDALLDVILRQLARATLADWGLVVLRSQFAERLEIRGRLNLPLTPAQTEAVAAGEGFLRPALGSPDGVLLHDFGTTPAFPTCPRLGFESTPLLLMPVAIGNQILGLIVLGGSHPGQFDLNDLNLARGVARQAAQAILNARHREDEQARARHGRQFVRF